MFKRAIKNSCCGVKIVPEEESKCDICGKADAEVVEVEHKELGTVRVCKDCVESLKSKGLLASEQPGSHCCCG
ncbi:MAG: hypothetical protein NO516_04385 [Candidatus Methanomethylicia archaeon]|nr:hypothetical protein [Candidatus Methanomethylicia archaeon]